MVISVFSAGSFAGSVYARKHSFSETIVRASESVDATLQVNDITHPVSVILHSGLESIDVTLRESIRDPNGRIVNTNEFSKDFFTTFKPNMTGEYTLLISNLGPNDVNIDGIFGFIPFVGGDDQVDLSSLNSIVTGVIVFIIGIIALIAGIIIVILDRRREKRRPPLTR
jgi:hypothetical protein